VDDDGEPLDDDRDASDFADTAVDEAEQTLRDFEIANAADIAVTGMSASQLGYDLWLTRNGHGAGFWDRGYGDPGKRLTDAANALGECNVWIDEQGKAVFG
jgi:hypothetical protein